MSAKIPADAFEFYMGLGPSRSYQAVADRYGVTKRAVVKHAAKERWAERLHEIQEKARAESDKELAADVTEMRDRHRKMLRAMAARALMGMKELSLKSGMEAIRAAELVIRMERIVFGEPTERGEESLEEITRREIQTLLKVDDDDEDGGTPQPPPVEPSGGDRGGHDPAQ